MIKINKLAFVDLSFHQSTKSADFLRNIFQKKYEIVNFWDEEWLGKNPISKKILKNFETIFYFQSINSYSDLNYLKNKNIVWAPMYDNLRLDRFFWRQIKFSNIRIIAFSEKIKNLCEFYEIPYIFSQYYIKPAESRKVSNKNKINIFFWYRGYIEIKDWIHLFEPGQVKIVCLEILDPKKKSQQISNNIIKNYDVTVEKKLFLKKYDYLNYVKNCDVFVCPRKAEGIGMSIVEALSLGKYLIGYKNNTMNEYIINNKIGFLFNSDTKDKVNISNIYKYFDYRVLNANNKYLQWKSQEEIILNFLNDNNLKSNYKISWIENLLYLINDIRILINRNLKIFTKLILKIND